MGIMATDFEPDKDAAALLARYKRARATEKQLLPLVKGIAPDLMREGATVSQLAEWTGLTDEVFRRIGRKHDIERLREPTVGKDAKPKTGDF
jgi:hypothetical protein